MASAISNREKQVAQLVAEDLTNKEIANKLGITQWTARNYVTSLIDKLEVNSRVGVAIKYISGVIL